MQRIYDRLEHILRLWKELELTKPIPPSTLPS
jgi:hypothetical protein